jgi:hypothetical protein
MIPHALTPKPREISGTMPGSPSLQTGAQKGEGEAAGACG